MTDTNHGGTPTDTPREPNTASHDPDAAWEEFEGNLAAYLATMVDPEEGDHLLVELTDPTPFDGAGCAPYAQFASFGDGEAIRAEISGNAHLRPRHQLDPAGCEFLDLMGWSGNDAAGDADEQNWFAMCPIADVGQIAAEVVIALRHYFGIAHPHLLTYDAWGPAAEGAGLLGLCATSDVPADEPTAPRTAPGRVRRPVLEQMAIKAADHDELRDLVRRLLGEKYDDEPTVDDDGDFVLEHMGQPVWIRVLVNQPAVEIMARVAHGVRSRRGTAVELGLLNRDNLWVRWTLRDRAVWQGLVLPAHPFVRRYLWWV
ncbi:MAG: hypothetical protein QM714_08340 [Nocardioides sp.]|uniref:TY-Chap domain-containing protein n=1 Tax=Nocardioides sp. TaxID=35761 RepID=UPI0039E213D8